MPQDSSKSIEACAAHYGDNAKAMRIYLEDGERRALALDNRGPLNFTEDGKLCPEIRAKYLKYGFYIFTNVLNNEELTDITEDLNALRARFPITSGAKTDAQGRPALGFGHKAPNLLWSKPLSDPLGGTAIANGRHQVKLFEPTAASNAPDYAPFILLGSLQFSPACLRVYGHPQLLKVAEGINGSDFAPFNECLFIKDPGLGAAVSWHQDGDTHWEAADFHPEIHGFNFMAQVYGSTAVNGVWVIPGSHQEGRADIKKMVADAGSERLPDALPIICDAGDVVICNRQLVHGSFANTGFEPRLTVNFGFHHRTSVLNVKGAGIHSEPMVYDEALIESRSRVIALAIDARRQKYPQEVSYHYKPLADKSNSASYRWSPATQESLKDYNLYDLSI